VPAAELERAVAEATDLLRTGCAERDTGDGWVELDLWAPAATAPGPRSLAGALRARGVSASVGSAPQDEAWREAMRAFHTPVDIGRRLRVRPPWAGALPFVPDVVIDPGMAFGTGRHATTRGCLEILVDLPAGSVLDAGCGSGVLAIAAARLGHAPVRAIDSDPLGVAATRANAGANGVSVEVTEARIGRDPLPEADLVVANLTAEVLAVLAPALQAAPPRRVIASGLRPHEEPGVIAAMVGPGLALSRAVRGDGWCTLLLERSP
jgi:ribosomal protein L11 methyltransferase